MAAAEDAAERLSRLEEQMRQITGRLAALEPAGRSAAASPGQWPDAGPAAIRGRDLGASAPEPGEIVVSMAGPDPVSGRQMAIRQRVRLSDALSVDPDGAAKIFAALASPARITVLQALLEGPRTSQQLRAELDDASVGQLYHHLRELLAAGLVIQPARSQYAIARGALPMLCIQLTTVARLAANLSLPIPPEEDIDAESER